MFEAFLDERDKKILSSFFFNLPEYNKRRGQNGHKLTEEEVGRYYLDLKKRGIITAEEKPPATETIAGLERLIYFRHLLGMIEIYSPMSFLEVLRSNKENPRINIKNRFSLAVNNACEKKCGNCASSSGEGGPQVDFGRLEALREDFLQLFTTVGFGLEGEPFFYSSGGKDLGDVVELLHQKGVKRFEFLSGGFFPANPIYQKVIDKLEEIARQGAEFNFEITYNHYVPDLGLNRESFLYTLEQLSRLPGEIKVKVLGDLSEKETNWEKTGRKLIELLHEEGFFQVGNSCYGQIAGRELTVKKVFSSLSYPVGRFKGRSQPEETESGRNSGLPPLCWHVSYEEFVVDHQGGVRFCPEMVSYEKKRVTNLYRNDFAEVVADLDKFHQKNYSFLRRNLKRIFYGGEKSCICLRE